MPSRRLLIVGVAGSVAARALRPAPLLARQTAPPPLMLQAAGGATRAGGIGACCWCGQCVDMQGTPFPECPLTISEGEALTLDPSALGAVASPPYSIWEADGGTWPAEPQWSGEIAMPPATPGGAPAGDIVFNGQPIVVFAGPSGSRPAPRT